MERKNGNKKQSKETKRKPITSDFGQYLRSLRHQNGIKVERLAESLSLSPCTVLNIENGTNPPPNVQRLELWLTILGERNRLNEAKMFLSSVRVKRSVRYTPRDEANEHIDRILDAYEAGRLSPTDMSLLQMIAPSEYL